MAYLTQEELKTVIRQNHLAKIVEDDDTIVEVAIEAAIDEVKSRLTPGRKKEWKDGRPFYDTEAIFAKEGENRNMLLLEITKTIALWWIVELSNAGVHYEKIEGRYDRAVAYLKDLASGEANINGLPLLPDEEPGQNSVLPFRSGSRPKFHHE